jgi:GT2 family glycosyltransferase
MDSYAQLSAVIVSATEPRAVLETCVAALRTGLPDCEIVVVDNSDSATRLAGLEEKLGNGKIVRGHGNVGYGRGNNLGVEAASGRYVLVVNPDAELVSVDEDALTSLLESDPLGLVAPLHTETDGARRFHVYPGDHWLVHLMWKQVVAPLWPRELTFRRRHARPDAKGAWVGGSFLLFRRDEFQAVGGFDDRFFLYYEDRDLSDRYRRAGLPLLTDPSLVVRHGEGASFGDEQAGEWRSTWRIMGWLEYVSIRDGSRSAKLALSALFAAYGLLGALLVAIPAPRMRRKGRELRGVREMVLRSHDLLPHAAAGSYPNAYGLLAERAR